MTTPSGEAYPFSEYEDMFRRAGVQRSEIHALEDISQHLIISHA